MTLATSPLSTVPSTDPIAAIFDADPAILTPTDHQRLLTELRRRRSEFASAEAAKAATPKAKRPKSAPVTPAQAAALDKPPGEVSLDDLLS